MIIIRWIRFEEIIDAVEVEEGKSISGVLAEKLTCDWTDMEIDDSIEIIEEEKAED